MKHTLFITISIVLSLIFCGDIVAQTCSSDFTIKAETSPSLCQGDGSLATTIEGATTNLFNIKYSLKSTTGLSVAAQNSNIFNNLPPGNYTVTVQAYCTIDGNYNVTKSLSDIVIGGEYTVPTVAIDSDHTRAAWGSYKTGKIALQVNGGKGNYRFEIVSAPDGITKGEVNATQTSTGFYHLDGDYFSGSYQITVLDDCYSAMLTFSLWSIQKLPYIGSQIAPLPAPNNACDSILITGDGHITDTDILQYMADDMIEIAVGFGNSGPLNWCPYKPELESVKDDMFPVNILPYTYDKMIQEPNHTIYVRVKGCPESQKSVTDTYAYLDTNKWVITSNSGYDCDFKHLRFWALPNAFWCYPLTYRIYSATKEYYNKTLNETEVTIPISNTDKDLISYQITDANGVQATGTIWNSSTIPSLYKNITEVGCDDANIRFYLEYPEKYNCLPITVEVYNATSGTLQGTTIINDAFASSSPAINVKRGEIYYRKVYDGNGVLLGQMPNETLLLYNSTPSSFKISNTISGCDGFNYGFISFAEAHPDTNIEYDYLPVGTQITYTGPNAFSYSYTIENKTAGDYNYNISIPKNSTFNKKPFLLMEPGTYHLNVVYPCEGGTVDQDIYFPGFIQQGDYSLDQTLDCTGLKITPRGNWTYLGESYNTPTQIIAGPAEVSFDKTVHYKDDPIVISTAGKYTIQTGKLDLTTPCPLIKTQEITVVIPPLVLEPNMTLAYLCLDGTPSISVKASGGLPPYTYALWDTTNIIREPVDSIISSGSALFKYGLADVTYTLRIKDRCGTSFNQHVTVKSLKDLRIASAKPAEVCLGDTIKLISVNLGDVSYKWTGPNGFTSTEKDPVIPNAVKEMNGEYTLEVDMNPICGGITTDVVKITVASDTITGTVTPNKSICYDANNKISCIATGGTGIYTYIWYTREKGQTTWNEIAESDNADYIIPTITTAGDYEYYVNVFDKCDSYNSSTISINVTSCSVYVNPNIKTR